jgi:hypothetical protein
LGAGSAFRHQINPEIGATIDSADLDEFLRLSVLCFCLNRVEMRSGIA